MREVNPEPVQSEVRKRKANTIYSHKHTESRKTVLTTLHAGQQRRRRRKDRPFLDGAGRRGWGWSERTALKHMLSCLRQAASGSQMHDAGAQSRRSVTTRKDGVGSEGEGAPREGTRVAYG